uniref:Uncharacterized protein n=1 Tax=Anguilla anguilla TaxID=7936 RepID=A0A0E9TE07_ANGAN
MILCSTEHAAMLGLSQKNRARTLKFKPAVLHST